MTLLDTATVPLNGQRLIAASAGTGKTYSITALVLRLVVELGLDISEILVVTFTEAATAELEREIRDRLRQAQAALAGDEPQARERLRRALARFDEASIFTIHGFCRRVLAEHAFESGVGFEAEVLSDDRPLVEEIARDFWAAEVYGAHPLFIELLEEDRLVPGRLAELVRTSALAQGAVIEPEAPLPTCGPEEVMRAIASARRLWELHGTAVVELLHSYPGLSRRGYQQRWIGSWLATLERYLSCSPPRLPRSEEREVLERFAQDRLVASTKKGCEPLSHPFFEAVGELVAKRDRFAAALLRFKRRFIDFFRAEVRRRKERLGVLTFDDLLVRVDEALGGARGPALAEALGRRFRAALIDEFQDTDQLQYRIFARIFGNGAKPFFLIGDPKQSIYAFRGADIYAYLDAVRRIEADSYSLEVSFRSTPTLIRALNHLFGRHRTPFAEERIPYVPVRPSAGALERADREDPAAALELRFLERAGGRTTGRRLPLISKERARRAVAEAVAREIAAELGARRGAKGPERAAKTAVLTRTRAESALVQQALARRGVAATLMGSESVFASVEAGELRDVLGAICRPAERRARNTALATRLFGLDAQEIAALDEDSGRAERWIEAFAAWRALLETRGVAFMLRELLRFRCEGVALSTRLLGRPQGARALTSYLHLGEILHERARQERLGPMGLLVRLDRLRGAADDGAGSSVEAEQIRLESDDAAVQVLTIHKAKGLEFETVYCPFLWGSLSEKTRGAQLFHDAADGHRLKIDIGGDEYEAHRGAAHEEAFAESLRLAYVALTRARRRLVVYCGAINEHGSSALSYLLFHPGGEAMTQEDAKRIESLDDAALRAELQRLAEGAPGAIAVTAVADQFGAPIVDLAAQGGFAARAFGGAIRPPKRFASFSSLETRAHDEPLPAAPKATPAHPILEVAPEIALADFERGARAGTCLHSIFENLDFQEQDARAVSDLVAAELDAHGLSSQMWTAVVTRAVLDALAVELDPARPGLALRTLEPKRRIAELDFVFPVAGVDPVAIAETVDRWSAAVPTDYTARLRRLPAPAAVRYLRGFVDLVFEHGGRYFLVDLKSNHLGGRYGDYAPDRLAREMERHHYFLQYHLYTVALHRHLARRLPDYDYERCFGGVYYLFLRGLSPARGASCGIFADRPPLRLVTALDEILGQGAARGGRS